MIVKKGEDRVAFIGERLTVKLARTSPRKAFERAGQIARRQGIKAILKEWIKYGPDDQQTLNHRLLHGIAANRRERRLARDFGRVVVPTISIIGGIANIQRTARPTGLSHDEIHSSFVEHLGPRVNKIIHMMERTDNLGISGGVVRFVDGGSDGLEELLRSNAEDVETSLQAVATAAGA